MPVTEELFDWRLPEERLSGLLGRLAALGPGRGIDRSSLVSESFRLWCGGDVAVYYAPFHSINLSARLMIVGVTPGSQQMEAACRAAAEALVAGKTESEALAAAKASGSFAGSMRTNLVEMLDEIGVAEALGLTTSATLFSERRDLLHTTSALRFPVLVGGRNYSGHKPKMLEHPILRAGVETTLRDELEATSAALVIPLGVAVEEALRHLIELGSLHGRRCALGFPHPSGANGHRGRIFAANKTRLREAVMAWLRV